MINLFEEKSCLAPDKDRVVKLFTSFNEPMVAPPRHHAQPTQAYICTYKEDDGYYVYACLYLTMEKTTVIYRSDDKFPTPDECEGLEDEAIQFAESMGFLMDDLKFNNLLTSQQEKLIETIPLFTPGKREVPAEIKTEVFAKEVSTEFKTAELETMGIEEIEAKEGVEEKEVIKIEKVSVEKVTVEEVEAKKEEVIKEDKEWEPEIFLSKFRMRAAAERARKDTK